MPTPPAAAPAAKKEAPTKEELDKKKAEDDKKKAEEALKDAKKKAEDDAAADAEAKEQNLENAIKAGQGLLDAVKGGVITKANAQFGTFINKVGACYQVEVMRPQMPETTDVEDVPETDQLHVWVKE